MIRFDYYSTDPSSVRGIQSYGLQVASAEVDHMSGGNAYMAKTGAEAAELAPGGYIAIQADSDRDDTCIGWGWFIEVTPATGPTYRVVER